MIRINLLPVRDSDRVAQGRVQLLIFGGILLFEVLALGMIYFSTVAQEEDLQKEVNNSSMDVDRMKKEVQDADNLKKEAETLQKQLDVLADLKKNRSGPVRVLDELQAIMSPPRNAEDRFAQLQKNWNAEWDTRRLWITDLVEGKDKSFEIKGGAANADDVAEFMQRLSTAEHFYEIQLDEVKAAATKDSKMKNREIRYVTFRLIGKLSYLGKSQEPAAPAAPPKGAPGRPPGRK